MLIISELYTLLDICCQTLEITSSTMGNAHWFGTYEYYKGGRNGKAIYKQVQKKYSFYTDDRYLHFTPETRWSVRNIISLLTLLTIIRNNNYAQHNITYLNYIQAGPNRTTTRNRIKHETCEEYCPEKCSNQWQYDYFNGMYSIWKLDTNIDIKCGRCIRIK